MVMQKYGKVYVLKKNFLEHQTMCGEIQENKKDLTGKKKKFSSFLWKTWLYLVYLNSISVKMMNRYVFLCVSNVFQYV